MLHARRIATPKTHRRALRSRGLAATLAERRLGGMALADYLFELFAASPYELFSRVSVLSVLDQVKKDKALFPDRDHKQSEITILAGT